MVGNEDTEAMLPVCICTQSHTGDDKLQEQRREKEGRNEKDPS
jgi:hypothetical protein